MPSALFSVVILLCNGVVGHDASQADQMQNAAASTTSATTETVPLCKSDANLSNIGVTSCSINNRCYLIEFTGDLQEKCATDSSNVYKTNFTICSKRGGRGKTETYTKFRWSMSPCVCLEETLLIFPLFKTKKLSTEWREKCDETTKTTTQSLSATTATSPPTSTPPQMTTEDNEEAFTTDANNETQKPVNGTDCNCECKGQKTDGDYVCYPRPDWVAMCVGLVLMFVAMLLMIALYQYHSRLLSQRLSLYVGYYERQEGERKAADEKAAEVKAAEVKAAEVKAAERKKGSGGKKRKAKWRGRK